MDTTYRILDANLNRAREAFRVIEDYARFVLNDSQLTTLVKETRHMLASIVPLQISTALMTSRDVSGDVGREVETPSEYHRKDEQSVMLAACKRLTEALRSIEEFGKTVDPEFARVVERLRYQAYDVERRLILTANARAQFGGVRLYVLLTESLCRAHWFETAKAALRGGADCIQLRERSVTDRTLLDRAERLADLCHEHKALLIINDRADIAALSGADGVHLAKTMRLCRPSDVLSLLDPCRRQHPHHRTIERGRNANARLHRRRPDVPESDKTARDDRRTFDALRRPSAYFITLGGHRRHRPHTYHTSLDSFALRGSRLFGGCFHPDVEEACARLKQRIMEHS